MFGTDTLNLDSALLCGEECVKVDPGPAFTEKISAAGKTRAGRVERLTEASV